MKLSKRFRKLKVINFIIKFKRFIFQYIIYKYTVFYLKKIRNFEKLEDIKTIGAGAGYYLNAYIKNKKYFLKVANRKRSSINEVRGHKAFYKENHFHHIKLYEYKYFFLVNYICFEHVNFVTLDKFTKTDCKNNFLSDLLSTIDNLYKTKTNHKDIDVLNIAIIESGGIMRLELFDFGVMDVDSKDFKNLFQKDLDNFKIIASKILSKSDYQIFCKKIKNYT